MSTYRKQNFKWAVLLLLCSASGCTKSPVSPQAGDNSPSPTTTPALSVADHRPPPTPEEIKSAEQNTQPTQSPQAAATAASPKKKFDEMTRQEKRPIVEEIQKMDMVAMFQAFLDAERIEKDSGKQMVISNLIFEGLRDRPPNPKFVEKLRKFIEGDEGTAFERGMILADLAIAATKETAALLVHEAVTLRDPQLRSQAISSIEELGRSYNLEIAPLVEPLWRESTDRTVLMPAANAMALIGAPSSIELLLAAALAPKGHDDERREIALAALQSVNSSPAVPPLAKALEENPIGTTANTMAFNTLAQIPRKEAPQALINWLQAIGSEAAPMAKEWITHANTPSQLEAAKAALDPKVAFRNEANREALRTGLEAYEAGHKLGE